MAEHRKKDIWDKITALGTFLGPVAIGIIGFLVTSHLSSNEASSRKAQLYATVMTERENAYSDIRAKTFDSLITHCFTIAFDAPNPTAIDFDKRLTMMEVLLDNFDDYFDAEPLFWLLHKQITERRERAPSDEKKVWDDFDQRLIRVAKSNSGREGAELAARGGGIIESVFVQPSREIDFASNTPTVMPHHIPLYPSGASEGSFRTLWSAPERQKNAERYSVAIEVHNFTEVSAQTSVFVFRDIYRGKGFDHSELLQKIDFESSYFSTPYVDNTLIGNDRFSLIYRGCFEFGTALPCPPVPSAAANPMAQFQVVVFDQQFMSQKEGPYIDEVVKRVSE